jgi:hypothetical protein
MIIPKYIKRSKYHPIRDDTGEPFIPYDKFMKHTWKEIICALEMLPKVKVYFTHQEDLSRILSFIPPNGLCATCEILNKQFNIYIFIEAAQMFTEDELNFTIYQMLAFNFINFDDDSDNDVLSLVKHHIDKINIKQYAMKLQLMVGGDMTVFEKIISFDLNFGDGNKIKKPQLPS